jgi:hypothetical protein
MHPHIDFLDQIIRLLGWPALIGMGVWIIRKYDAGQQDFKALSAHTKIAAETVMCVKSELDTLKSNHLAHLAEGINALSVSNDKAVDVLQEINGGIKLLIDRTPRA